MRDYILLYVNGQEQRVSASNAFQPASDYLRLDLGKCGTKVVCAEGDCGACSVMVGRLGQEGKLEYAPINSCIQYLYQLDCSHLITVEGLKVDGQLNPVQQSMVDANGAQCGYCTPGFVVAMCGLANQLKTEKSCQATEKQVKDSLTGNLCRCTGYEAIIAAGMKVDLERYKPFDALYAEKVMVESFRAHAQSELLLETPTRTAFSPNSLAAACKFLDEHEKVVIVSGGTDVSVNMNKRDLTPAYVMSTAALPGLEELEVIDSEEAGGRKIISIGARVTLRRLEYLMLALCPEFHQILWVYGSPQIRHAATLAGNIANGSPIADSTPFLFLMEAIVEVTGCGGVRQIAMADFYKGYKQLSLRKDELITRILLPLPLESELFKLYKISRRQHLDISAFTAAIRVSLENNKIVQAVVVFGGVGPVVKRCFEVEQALLGEMHQLSTYEAAGKVARAVIAPITDVRGSKDFRLTLAENILSKFFYDTADQGSQKELACR